MTTPAAGSSGGRTSTGMAISSHLLSAITLVSAYRLVVQHFYGLDLVTHPAQTLRLVLIIKTPVTIGSYSWLRRDPQQCSLLKAAVRGLLALPIGKLAIVNRALVNSFAAIVLGAPVGIKYLPRTFYWSLLMSLLTVVPAACVFGSSKMDWQHFLGLSKPTDTVTCMIGLPAYGAVLGAWLGAWPMPLDWERLWQEWPISVTYGAAAGYLCGLIASAVCIVLIARSTHAKKD